MSALVPFDDLVRRATGRPEVEPYAYQRRLVEEGLPDLLRVPTGAGKTLAAVLPWLYRRLHHPDPAVRRDTPRWLVVVLPQRTLVEQTVEVVGGWMRALGGQVPVHVLMGGSSSDDRAWKMHPGRDAVFVGTQDMVLSRLLLRGYAEPRAGWPIAFGLLHAGAQYVFDEVQLMGLALPTSLQLHALHTAFGTAAPVRSTWMSATVDPADLRTVDHDGPRTVVELDEHDRRGPLRHRLEATRTVERADTGDDPRRHPVRLAEEILARHTPGTRTIVVANTVARAGAVHDVLARARPAADLVLLHSRFRPGDRDRQTRRALADPGPAGTIVVATQVLEAGVDVSSRLLVTEVAPWSSLVQRAGRCNRAGESEAATLMWTLPPAERGAHLPYAEEDLVASAAALAALEGRAVTSTDLQRGAVEERRPLHPVLRRRDLLDLFDTAPDLSGNDLDVGRWVRDADVTTAAVAWRPLAGDAPEPDTFPARDELCPVPLADLRERIAVTGHRSLTYDQTEGRWRPARREDVRPGAMVVLDAARGGYLPDRGWTPTAASPVEPVPAATEAPDAVPADPLSLGQGGWVALAEHLGDVRRDVARVLAELGDLPGLTAAHREAAALAGLFHDLGKAHPVFAATLAASAVPPAEGGPWAKSPTRGGRHGRPYFRHELVSALMLLDPGAGLLAGAAEPDLVAYLVAAHHGKVRLSVRAMPGEQDGGTVLGVADGDASLPVTVDGTAVPSLTLRLDRLRLGADGADHDSWQALACGLRDRADLGPFRLGFLEAVVRMADWRVSAGDDRAGGRRR